MFSKLFGFLKKSADVEKETQQLGKRVQELVAEAKTVEAIDLMIEAGIKDAPMLKNQWLTALETFENGKMPYDVWASTNNRINFAILEMLRPRNDNFIPAPASVRKENTEAPIEQEGTAIALTKEQVAEIRYLLDGKGLGEALSACSKWNHVFYLIHHRFVDLKRIWHMGLITEEEWNRGNSQIKHALISCLDEQATEPD
ncbi:MAG: hypothetical protein U0U46_17670 [Saprospiraceae bacterium]